MKKRVRIYAEGGIAEEQPQMEQQGGGQMEQLMGAVQQMIEQGAQPVQVAQQLLGSQVPPEAIMQVFVQMGMPQEEAQMSIQQAMQGGQEQQMQGPGEEQMEGAASNPQEEQIEMQQPEGPTDEQLQMAFGGPAPLNENSTSYIRDRQANFINAIRKNTFSAMAKKNIFGNDGNKMKYGGDLPKADLGNAGDYKTKDEYELAIHRYNADPNNTTKLDFNTEMAKWKDPQPTYDANKMYKPDGKGGWTEVQTGAAQNPNIIYLQNPYGFGYNPRPINRLFNTPMRMPSYYNVHGLAPGMTPNMFMGKNPGGKLDDGRTWGVSNVDQYKEGPFWNRHKGVRYTINWGNGASGNNAASTNLAQNNQPVNNVSSNTNSRINKDGSLDGSVYSPASYETNKDAKKNNAENPDPYADPFYKPDATNTSAEPGLNPFSEEGGYDFSKDKYRTSFRAKRAKQQDPYADPNYKADAYIHSAEPGLNPFNEEFGYDLSKDKYRTSSEAKRAERKEQRKLKSADAKTTIDPNNVTENNTVTNFYNPYDYPIVDFKSLSPEDAKIRADKAWLEQGIKKSNTDATRRYFSDGTPATFDYDQGRWVKDDTVYAENLFKFGGNLYKATGGVDAMAIRPRPSLGVSPERLAEMRTLQQEPTVVDFQEQKGRINPMWLNAAADTMMNTLTGVNSFAAQMAQYDPEYERAMKSASNASAGQLQNQGYDQFGNFMGGNQMGAQNLNPTNTDYSRSNKVYSLGGKVYDLGGEYELTPEEVRILENSGFKLKRK